ncbi:MAG: AraC family transcriptional regulator [Balneolaceae bacterium]|nr:AraC family transcriptional regulator [Balneolaceae bacterium]
MATGGSEQVIFIKNMVCPRCVMVVRDTLNDLGFDVEEVELGKAVVRSADDDSLSELQQALNEHGFELLQGREEQIVEQIKTRLVEYVRRSEMNKEMPKISTFLSDRLHQNYASLSSLFSKKENITIEKYLIHLRIERVKELLSYEELTLSEIAWKLNYSSVQHLSSQFKQVTGMSVTDYKKASDTFRKPLDFTD